MPIMVENLISLFSVIKDFAVNGKFVEWVEVQMAALCMVPYATNSFDAFLIPQRVQFSFAIKPFNLMFPKNLVQNGYFGYFSDILYSEFLFLII